MANEPLKNLSARHRKFVDYYLQDMNAARAARLAGFAESSAKHYGYQLLQDPLIAAEIKRLQDEMATKLHINLEMVLREYMRVAFANLTHVASWGDDGTLKLTPSEDLAPDEAAAIAEVTTKAVVLGSTLDDGQIMQVTSKVKMHPKIAALKEITRVLGLIEGRDAELDDGGEEGRGLASLLNAAKLRGLDPPPQNPQGKKDG